MLKNKKANSKGSEKSNKIIKKIGGENPKKKKHQLEKVKKSIKMDLDNPEPVLSEVNELQDENQGEISEDASDTDVESVNGDAETEECTEGIGQTLLVGNIPPETRRVQLVTLFAPYGRVMSIIFNSDKRFFFKSTVDKAGINAYIVLDSIEAADKALKLNGSDFNGSQLFVRKPKEEQKCGPINKVKVISNSNNTVYIADMSKNSTKKSLKVFFSSCGKIAYINIKKGPNGKRIAFVCFKSPDSVDLALETNGKILDEEPIIVEKYCPKSKSKVLDKGTFKNLSKEELNGKMLKLSQKGIKPIEGKNKKTPGEKNSDFRGVKSGGIKKAPKKKPNKTASKE